MNSGLRFTHPRLRFMNSNSWVIDANSRLVYEPSIGFVNIFGEYCECKFLLDTYEPSIISKPCARYLSLRMTNLTHH